MWSVNRSRLRLPAALCWSLSPRRQFAFEGRSLCRVDHPSKTADVTRPTTVLSVEPNPTLGKQAQKEIWTNPGIDWDWMTRSSQIFR